MIDRRRQFGRQLDPQPIHGTRRQGDGKTHAARGIPLPGKRPVELHLPRAFGQHLQLAVAGYSQNGGSAVGSDPLGPGDRQIAGVQGHEHGAGDRLRDIERGAALQQGLALEPRIVLRLDKADGGLRRHAGSRPLDRRQQALELAGLHGQILHVALGPLLHPLGKIDPAETQFARLGRFSAGRRGRRRAPLAEQPEQQQRCKK